jgi:hypothetical protein
MEGNMKSILFIFIVLLNALFVVAGPAGTYEVVHHFDKCNTIRVFVEGEYVINNNEYSIINCTETSNNSWFCECDNNYDLILLTDIQTKNNYIFSINYNYSIESSSRSRSSHSSRGFDYIPEFNITKVNKTDDNITKDIIFKEEKIPIIKKEKDKVISKEIVINENYKPNIEWGKSLITNNDFKDKKSYFIYWLIGFLLIFILIIFGIFLGIMWW